MNEGGRGAACATAPIREKTRTAGYKTHFRDADTILEIIAEMTMLRLNITKKNPYPTGTNTLRVKQVVEINGKNGKLCREWIKSAHPGVDCPFSTDFRKWHIPEAGWRKSG